MGETEQGILLIVDDSDDEYDILQMALEHCDFPLEAHRRCRGGAEALDYLTRQGPFAGPGAAPTPSLIFLDLNMPGMDGRETLRRIKGAAELRDIPVVVMTNSRNEEDVAFCYRHGANSYVRKSADWTRWRQVIGATLAFWLGAAMIPSQAAAAAYAPEAKAASAFTQTQRLEGGSMLFEGEEVHPPQGFVEMCRRRPELCPSLSVQADLVGVTRQMTALFGKGALSVDVPEFSAQRLAALERVNSVVNASIRPKSDGRRDSWDLGATAGDCEDYVLMKREMLARLGWPRTALRITVVHDGSGYHAVLVVRTQSGELLLDNMSPRVKPIGDSAYQFVVAQSVKDAGRWVRVTRG